MIDSELEYQSSEIPLLFTSKVFFSETQSSFEQSLNRNFCDYQAFCIDRLTNDNNINDFCEALKVDVAKSHESDTQDSVSQTILLITVLFEDMGVAMKLMILHFKKHQQRK
jgi:hypothetical protein